MLSMALFLIVNVVYFKERLYTVKHIGIGFIFVASAMIVVVGVLPVAESFYGVREWGVGGLGVGIGGVVVAYGRKFRTDIIMFLAKVEKIKSFNQKITLIKANPP